MFTALLLPLLLAAGPNGSMRAGHAAGGDPPAIQLWISDDRRFLPGDRAKVQVRTREDGYLIVLHSDPDGHLRVLFPLDPKDDNFVRGGKKYELRGRAGREAFTVDNRTGRGTVYAAVSHDPMRFDQFTLDDHWDYRNLAPQRLSAEPEQELNDLVRRMVDGGFDYDILTYDVLERVVYADRYSSVYDSYAYDCGYSYFGCRPYSGYYGSPYSISIGFYFGRPFYRRYYDPFYAGFDPFYDPFFYSPYYYRPVYAYPVYNYPYYGYPYYGYPYRNTYYPPRYRDWNRPYTPYRFRPADGTLAGYRDRRYDLRRSVNTVYMPPVVRDRQPANADPVRRVVEDRPPAATTPNRRAGAATGPADRGAARRAERAPSQRLAQPDAGRPNIEARRAREPEERRSIAPESRDAMDPRSRPSEVRAPERSPARNDAPARRTDDGPRRSAVDRPADPPQEVRGNDGRGSDVRRGDSRPEPQFEPRRADPPRADPPRADPPRGEPQGGDRGGWSAPPARGGGGSSYGGSGGSGSGGGGSGGGGGDRGGGRRR